MERLVDVKLISFSLITAILNERQCQQYKKNNLITLINKAVHFIHHSPRKYGFDYQFIFNIAIKYFMIFYSGLLK